MFLNVATMNFIVKNSILFLLMEVPSFIADLEQPSAQHQSDIDNINKMQNLWTADTNYFDKLSEPEISARMGSRIDPEDSKAPARSLAREGKQIKRIPKKFDARKEWPGCHSIGAVKDQAACGSCWAVSAAAAFSDRICIAHKQKSNIHFSAEDLLSCCKDCLPPENYGDGCLGGYVAKAFYFIGTHGIVSGGDYGSVDNCMPYSFKPCNKSIPGNCKQEHSRPCKSKCTNAYYKYPYQMDKRFGGISYSLDDVRSAKLDIMKRGPIVALMVSCWDFLHYFSGIYFHIFGPCEEVYHAVKIIGWGEEYGVDYWLVMNTWNTSWGDKGTFKIKVKDNNSDFGYFSAGDAKLL